MYSEKHEMHPVSIDTIISIGFAIIGIAATIIWARNPNRSIWVIIIPVFLSIISLFWVWFFHRRSLLLKKSLDNVAFMKYWKQREIKIYIPMNITTKSEENAERFPLTEYLVSLIAKKQVESKYICLMGDIGSGKTDALVHFFETYVKKYSHRPFMPSKVRLYSMIIGYQKLIEKIQEDFPKSSDKSGCILLLDALDECKEAQASLKNIPENNPSIFMGKLAESTKDFATVVVSCRRQFFMTEAYQPGKTPVEIGNPLTPDPFLHWQKLYIAPFNNEQVDLYLSKRYKKDESIRKAAHEIIDSCNEIFFRPFLLSHIDILLEAYRQRQESLSMKEIFDTIVYYWMQREAKDIEIDINKKLNASLSLAKYMYKKELTCLDDEHYKSFCNVYNIEDADNLLRVKSLLNNDKNGFSFSHKSFYEYLLAYAFFLDSDLIGEVQGLDFAVQIYVEIYDAYMSEEKPSKIEQRLKTREVLADKVADGLIKCANGLLDFHQYLSAENCFQKALMLNRQLTLNNPNAFIDDVVETLIKLASLHINTLQYNKAEEEFTEALVTIQQLAKNNLNFLPDLAGTLNNLANLHSNTHQYKEAESEYIEALDIYRRLTEKDANAFLPNLAITLNNLANLHSDIHRYKEAETEYTEALDIYRRLTEKDANAFLPNLAITLNNLANLHNSSYYYDIAETEYMESMIIYRQLVEKTPDAFLPYLALALRNLANQHSNRNYLDKAEVEFQETLSICRQLAEKNPDAFLPDLASTLFGMAVLHKRQYQLDLAETEVQESLTIYQQMAEMSHEAFDIEVEKAQQLLDEIRSKRK